VFIFNVFISAIYWFSYEYVKLAQLRHQGNEEVTFLQSFIAGATAGTVSITAVRKYISLPGFSTTLIKVSLFGTLDVLILRK